jgi:hypothetical protein
MKNWPEFRLLKSTVRTKMFRMFVAQRKLKMSSTTFCQIKYYYINHFSQQSNLSVLNLSGNSRLTDLPPQMGLLQKLWNLNTRGCNLTEPLATMMNSKIYKTSDVIGYLRLKLH